MSMSSNRRESRESLEIEAFLQKTYDDVGEDELPPVEEHHEDDTSGGVDIPAEDMPPPLPPLPEKVEATANVLSGDDDESDESSDSADDSSEGENKPETETGEEDKNESPPSESPAVDGAAAETQRRRRRPSITDSLSFDQIMNDAEATRRSSYDSRATGEEVMGTLRKTMSYDVENLDELLPPPATKRGTVLRKFDRDSPNFFGMTCWAERYLVVESQELSYYLSKGKMEEAATGPAACLSRHNLASVSAEGGSSEDPDDACCFRVTIASEGTISHRVGDEETASAWLRLFRESPELNHCAATAVSVGHAHVSKAAAAAEEAWNNEEDLGVGEAAATECGELRSPNNADKMSGGGMNMFGTDDGGGDDY